MPKPATTTTTSSGKKRGRPPKALPSSPLKKSKSPSPSKQKSPPKQAQKPSPPPPSPKRPRGRPKKDVNTTVSFFDPRLPPPPPPPPPVNNPFYQKFVKEYWEKNYPPAEAAASPIGKTDASDEVATTFV